MRFHPISVPSLFFLFCAMATPSVAQGPGGAREVKPPGEPPSEQSTDLETLPREKGGVSAALNDLWLTTVAKARLIRNEEVSARDVDVDVRDGVVTLFGMVPTVSAHAAAELEIVKMEGVARVENLLEVVPEPIQEATRRHDRALENEVRGRLEAREETADLDVVVCNGVARLRGSLESSEQRQVALQAVRETAGVREVVDQLQVQGTPAKQPTASS